MSDTFAESAMNKRVEDIIFDGQPWWDSAVVVGSWSDVPALLSDSIVPVMLNKMDIVIAQNEFSKVLTPESTHYCR